MIAERYRWLMLGLLLGIILGGTGVYFLPARNGKSIADSAPAKRSTNSRIYFSGEIRAQGAISVQPGDKITLTQALVLKGGLTDFADRTKIKIVRAGTPIGTEPEIVNLKEIVDDNHFEKDPVLAPGDMVVVYKRLVNF